MCCSVTESSEDVASSYSRIGASFRIARAMATRCFSPPAGYQRRAYHAKIVCGKTRYRIDQADDDPCAQEWPDTHTGQDMSRTHT
jgi:hypothetical protein